MRLVERAPGAALGRRHRPAVERGLDAACELRRADRADHVSDDVSVARDEEGLRHPCETPPPRGCPRVVTDVRERESVPLDELEGVPAGILLIYADQQDAAALASPPGVDQAWRLCAARGAPGSPEVDHDRRALQLVKAHSSVGCGAAPTSHMA